MRKKAEKQIFKVALEKAEDSNATRITIPFDFEAIFGAKRVPVKVKINGAEHRSTVMRMGGKYMMVVPKVFREAANIEVGQMITVEMERDDEPRVITPPKDFADALRKADLQDAFSKMSYTHQKEYVRAIEDAKKKETRLRRIDKAIEDIGKKK